MLSTVVMTASVSLGTALLYGVVVALLGIFMAPDAEATIDFAANAFWLLAGLMPIALWLGLSMTHDEEDHAAIYNNLPVTVLTAIQAALLGSALGAGPFYFLAVSYLSGILRGFDVPTFSASLRSQILWGPWLWVVAITLIASLPLAFWAYRTSPSRA